MEMGFSRQFLREFTAKDTNMIIFTEQYGNESNTLAQRILDLGKEKVIKEVLYQRVDVVPRPQQPASSK